jgi:hypothetical protein
MGQIKCFSRAVDEQSAEMMSKGWHYAGELMLDEIEED